MRLKVLVVDDDVPTLELMREVLISLGVDVHAFRDSELAAALITQEKFDGIFLDLMMPKVDGFELARQIRRSPSNSRSPIVIVTGRTDRKTMDDAFAAGATFFLHKPVNKANLIRLLNSTRGSMLEERRRYKRASLRTPVTCRAGAHTFTGLSANLSQSGILFESDGSLKPGSSVRLAFRLPEQKAALEVEGVVARVDEKRRAGVRFTEISAEDRQRLRDLVASQDTA